MAEMDKRLAILHAAQEIFSRKMLKDSTVTEIAQKAGVVDSIIYHYFKNKEDLLFWAFRDSMEASYEELMFQLKGILGPVSMLGKMIWHHLHQIDSNPGYARMVTNLLLECRSNPNFYCHESIDTYWKYLDVLLDILKIGITDGYFKEDLNPAVVRHMIFGLLYEVSISCLETGEITEATPHFDGIMSIILAMIEKKGSAPNGGDKASRILSAATQVFADKGYNKATMLDVAQKAGVAEGTIYEYFKNKQDLLMSIPKEHFQHHRTSLNKGCDATDSMDRLKRLIGVYFSVFLSNPEFLKVFLSDIKLNKQFYASDAYPYYIQYIQPLSDILEEGKRRGVFRPEVDNRIFRYLFVGSFTHLCLRWFLEGNATPLSMMVEFAEMSKLLCRAPKSIHCGLEFYAGDGLV